MERRGVAVQDEEDGEVEGAEGDLETTAEAAQQDVLAREALADAAAAATAGRVMVAVAGTRPHKAVCVRAHRQVVAAGGGRGSCG